MIQFVQLGRFKKKSWDIKREKKILSIIHSLQSSFLFLPSFFKSLFFILSTRLSFFFLPVLLFSFLPSFDFFILAYFFPFFLLFFCLSFFYIFSISVNFFHLFFSPFFLCNFLFFLFPLIFTPSSFISFSLFLLSIILPSSPIVKARWILDFCRFFGDFQLCRSISFCCRVQSNDNQNIYRSI